MTTTNSIEILNSEVYFELLKQVVSEVKSVRIVLSQKIID